MLKSIIGMMLEYTIIHFATEEAMLKEVHYKAIDEHILLHRQLLGQIKSASNTALINQDAEPLLRMLKSWWMGHINRDDRDYALNFKGG